MAESIPSQTAEEIFATNLRSMRANMGFSQDVFAQLMTQRGYKWHQATVYKVENGTRQIQLGEAQAAADILGVALSQMTRGTDAVEITNEIRTLVSRIEAEARRAQEATHAYRVLQEELQELLDAQPEETRMFLTDAEVDRIELCLLRPPEPQSGIAE